MVCIRILLLSSDTLNREEGCGSRGHWEHRAVTAGPGRKCAATGTLSTDAGGGSAGGDCVRGERLHPSVWGWRLDWGSLRLGDQTVSWSFVSRTSARLTDWRERLTLFRIWLVIVLEGGDFPRNPCQVRTYGGTKSKGCISFWFCGPDKGREGLCWLMVWVCNLSWWGSLDIRVLRQVITSHSQ